MRNKYPGVCYRCGEMVEPGEGHFERVNGNQRKKWGVGFTCRWLTQHARCAIQYRGTDRHFKFNPV